jgi:hypothetical protein
MARELDRLIDLELVRQELESFAIGGPDEEMVRARLEELRRGYAEIGGLPVLLRRLGMQESELASYLRLQTMILKFIGFRFRPFVSVSESEVEAYYAQRLSPELSKSGVQAPPLAELREKIRQLLTEEKINAAMDEWVKNTRASTRIEVFWPQETPVKEAKP